MGDQDRRPHLHPRGGMSGLRGGGTVTISVCDLEHGQAAIRRDTGVMDGLGLYIWDETRDVSVWMSWDDAVRMAEWIQKEAGRLR